MVTPSAGANSLPDAETALRALALEPALRTVVGRMAEKLAGVVGIRALALGGSYARRTARTGRTRWDYAHQPVYGFYAVSYLADLVDCVALFDPERELARLAEPVAAYPEKLRAAIVQNALWGAEVSLRQGPGFAARGDVYDTVGLLTRVCAYLTQALFALNERYFANDKHAMATIAGFELRPADYPSRVAALLAAPGRTAAQLAASVAALDSLFREVGELAGPLYRVRHP